LYHSTTSYFFWIVERNKKLSWSVFLRELGSLPSRQK
jgi:hypothetical protein